jgi:hypothetical protein
MSHAVINNFMQQCPDDEENDHDTPLQNEYPHTDYQKRGAESPSFNTPHPTRAIPMQTTNAIKNYHAFYSFMENQLIESVKASLNNELFVNATFLCERLYAQV